jgi:hypothetical protein
LWIVDVVKETVFRRRVAGAVGTWQRKCCGKMVNRWSRPRNKRDGITRTGPMYVWWYRTGPMGAAAPIGLAKMVAHWIGESKSFFWAAPVSRLLERLTDVPRKLKKQNNVREIDVGLKMNVFFGLVWIYPVPFCHWLSSGDESDDWGLRVRTVRWWIYYLHSLLDWSLSLLQDH